jgi:ankyrin repeat protein
MSLRNERELHEACEEGDHDKVRYLLKAQTRAHTFNNRGFPPLIIAAVNGNIKCIHALLELGKNVHIEMETRSTGETALFVVISSYRSFTAFTEEQSQEQIALNNRIRIAKNEKLIEALVVLLQYNANMASPRRLGQTPLHIACKQGFYRAVELLLPCFYVSNVGERIDVSVHSVDCSMRTPLHFACMNGHSNIVRLLLQWGSNPIAMNKYGVSCLHLAISNLYPEVVQIIFTEFCQVGDKRLNSSVDEQKHRVLLLQQEIHRKVATQVLQHDSKKANTGQSVLAIARDNAQLLNVLLRGPTCLNGVIRYSYSIRPEVIAATNKRRKINRKRRREARRIKEMHKRIGKLNPNMGVPGGVLSGVIWEEEQPGPKQKPELQWMYLDKMQGGAILGPVSSSKMRSWYTCGKLPLDLMVYPIPKNKDSAITNEPPQPSILNMAARGQGPFALGPVWNPKDNPHKQRQLAEMDKFKSLRVILSEMGGPKNAFGAPTGIATMFGTKMMAMKWKKKSKGSRKFLSDDEYDSDESSGIEDEFQEIDKTWEEIEEENKYNEELNINLKSEFERLWMNSDFINDCDSNSKRTPLANACENGWYDAAVVLLEVGNARLDQKDCYGFTPLNLAARNGHLDIVKLILKYDRGKKTLSVKDNSYHWSPIVWSAGQGNLEITKALIDAGADVENYRVEATWWQAGALGVAACKKGNQKVIKELLKAGADVNRVGGESSRITPLHAAAAQGNSHVVEALIKCGKADLDIRDSNSATALMLACRGGHVRCARLLMDLGADWQMQTRGGWTALMYASEGGFSKIVYRMLHWRKKPRTIHGLDVVNETSDSSSSSVPTLPSINLASFGVAKIAAKKVHDRATKAVIDKNNGVVPTTQHFMGIAYTPTKKDIIPEKKDKKVDTFFNTEGSKLSRHKLALVSCQETHTSCNAIHLATRFGHSKVLLHLLKCKLPLDIIECRSGTAQTPLGIACFFGHFDCAELLIKYGADPESRQGDLKTGPTPLMQAAQNGFVQIVKMLLPIVDTEVLNAYHQNAGQIAAANGHKEVFQFIASERKIRQRKIASQLREKYEQEEAIRAAEKKELEDRRKKEQAFKNAMIKKNKEIEKERLRLLAEEEEKRKKRSKNRKKKKLEKKNSDKNRKSGKKKKTTKNREKVKKEKKKSRSKKAKSKKSTK